MQSLTRRHVMATLTGSAVLLCPAILNARGSLEFDWAGATLPENLPHNAGEIAMLGAGPASVDVTALAPGEVAVVGRPTTNPEYENTGMIQYIAVLRRTADQIAYGAANDRPGVVQDPRYLVVDLLCPHRGKAIGLTGLPHAPFACTDRGRRHSSIFDETGFGVSGASEDEGMTIPAYTIEVAGEGAAVTRAVVTLA